MRKIVRGLTCACLFVTLAAAPQSGARADDCDVASVADVLSQAMKVALEKDSKTMSKQRLRSRLVRLETSPKAQSDFYYGFKKSYPECSEAQAQQALKIALDAMHDYLD